MATTATYEWLMERVSYSLIEPIVNTTITAIFINPGVTTFQPASMLYIYVGALLLLDVGAAQEVITVSSTTPTTFTATTVNTHLTGIPLVGSTFPSGVPDAPLFTQSEIIGYINDSQTDFLRDVRPLYAVATVPVNTAQRFYTQPADCIRLERIAINPGGPTNYQTMTMDLYETSQSSLDLSDPSWQGSQGLPLQWFRDQIATAQYGYTPAPSANFGAELWYSQNVLTAGSTLNTILVVPDLFVYALKYSVLAKAWSKDGEVRDPVRSQFAEKKCEFLTMLAVKFMNGAGVNMPTGARGDPSFSPMPVMQGAANA